MSLSSTASRHRAVPRRSSSFDRRWRPRIRSTRALSRARHECADGLRRLSLGGCVVVSKSARSRCASLRASRRSVLTRSPGFSRNQRRRDHVTAGCARRSADAPGRISSARPHNSIRWGLARLVPDGGAGISRGFRRSPHRHARPRSPDRRSAIKRSRRTRPESAIDFVRGTQGRRQRSNRHGRNPRPRGHDRSRRRDGEGRERRVRRLAESRRRPRHRDRPG